jgi:hypothetical protein
MEQETGEKMPRTYTVCSGPTSAPYKRHFYFTQTEYSFKKFGGVNAKNINRRDTSHLVPSPSGGLMYPTQYDVKGIGGGAIVVAAGSPRQPDANGNVEYYRRREAFLSGTFPSKAVPVHPTRNWKARVR